MGDVVTELRDAVLTVTLHRPGRLNALSLSLQRELAELWARVRRDAGVRCIVVTGSGRAFCAGADVADLAAMTAPARGDRGRIEFCPSGCVDVPVIAAGELGPRASEIAVGVAAQSPAAVRATVAALRRRHRAALGTQLAQAWADVARQRVHPDAAEGARALTEKRPAQWSQPCGSGQQGAP